MLRDFLTQLTIVAFVLSACVSEPLAGQSLESVVPFDEESMRSAARYCARDYGKGIEEQPGLCQATFYCGDGGCDPQSFVAVLPKELEATFRSSLAKLPVSEYHLCSREDEFEAQYVDFEPGSFLTYFGSFTYSGGDHTAFCGETIPGYENDIVLALRQIDPSKVIVVRTGGEAGSPPAHMKITELQFTGARRNGVENLRLPLVQAIESLTGQSCETSSRQTCSVVAEQGRLKAKLLFADGVMTGRSGNWEQVYLEIYPNQLSGDYYALSFDMPITSIRRWPSDRAKPSSGFTSLDFDEGFESFRFDLMSKIADAVGGTPVSWD